MEAKSLSQCGSLKGWSIFEVIGTDKRHIIGYSPAYDFDVITQEIAFFEYDKRSKKGRAITKAGILYTLDGRPLLINPRGHPQLREFTEVNQCKIRFIRQ